MAPWAGFGSNRTYENGLLVVASRQFTGTSINLREDSRHSCAWGVFSQVDAANHACGARFAVRVRKGTGAGLRLSLDTRYEAQYAAGFHETALLACLAAHLKPGDVLYDVGAHIGYISLVAARLVGPSGKVFAFEADPENARRIIGHAEMNALPQVELVGAAVWSERKTLSFTGQRLHPAGTPGQ